MGGKAVREQLWLDYVELTHWSVGNGDLDTKLELGFGSTIELLVDGRVIAIERYVSASTVGKSLEEYVLSRRDSEELSKLQHKPSVSVQWTKKSEI